jgi:hypothetical protein
MAYQLPNNTTKNLQRYDVRRRSESGLEYMNFPMLNPSRIREIASPAFAGKLVSGTEK